MKFAQLDDRKKLRILVSVLIVYLLLETFLSSYFQYKLIRLGPYFSMLFFIPLALLLWPISKLIRPKHRILSGLFRFYVIFCVVLLPVVLVVSIFFGGKTPVTQEVFVQTMERYSIPVSDRTDNGAYQHALSIFDAGEDDLQIEAYYMDTDNTAWVLYTQLSRALEVNRSGGSYRITRFSFPSHAYYTIEAGGVYSYVSVRKNLVLSARCTAAQKELLLEILDALDT